jgi:hypothetical protein
MYYTKPFTLTQRQKALAVYRSMRVHLDKMRFDFPPSTLQQKTLVRQYRDAVRDFAHTLRRPDAKVDVDQLNESQDRSVTIALEYTVLLIKGRSDG